MWEVELELVFNEELNEADVDVDAPEVEIGKGNSLKDSDKEVIVDGSGVSEEISEDDITSDFLKVLGRAETVSEKGTWIGAGAGAEISTGVLAYVWNDQKRNKKKKKEILFYLINCDLFDNLINRGNFLIEFLSNRLGFN